MQRVMWVAVALVAVALAGCADDGPQLRGATVVIKQSNMSVDRTTGEFSAQGTLGCGEIGRIDVDASGFETNENGTATDSLSVAVREGNGIPRHFRDITSDEEGSYSLDLTGGPGVWSLKVDRNVGYDGSFTVTLTC